MKMTRTRFARVCVEVGMNFDYPASILDDLATRIGSVNASINGKPRLVVDIQHLTIV